MADSDADMLDKHCDLLREHFDTVQIFCTQYDSGQGTKAAVRGSGNWYARDSVCREWLARNDEQSRVAIRKDNEDD